MAVAEILENEPRVLPADARALILFNPKAGGVTEADREKLEATLTESGITRFTFVEPDDIVEQSFRGAWDVVIVLGGDGTARAVAECAPPDGPPLILLPGGTLNVLPRALYGERAWPEALKDVLTRGVIRRLGCGRANNKRFFVAAIFGAPTLLARAREAVREGRFLAAFHRLRHYLKRAFSRSLTAHAPPAPRLRAEAVGVLAPSFSGAIEGDDLEWATLQASQLTELARVSLKALGAAWRDDPAMHVSRGRQGVIMSNGVIPAVLDGEPKTFVSYVRIRYDENGPRVIALED